MMSLLPMLSNPDGERYAAPGAMSDGDIIDPCWEETKTKTASQKVSNTDTDTDIELIETPQLQLQLQLLLQASSSWLSSSHGSSASQPGRLQALTVSSRGDISDSAASVMTRWRRGVIGIGLIGWIWRLQALLDDLGPMHIDRYAMVGSSRVPVRLAGLCI